MLLGCNHAPWDMHRQTFPVLYRWDIFRVSCLEAWRAGEFARGILTRLCGRLKEEEQIEHKLSTQLKSHVWLQSEPRQEYAMCLSLQQYNKLSGMACNSLLWLIIDRHLASDISYLCFGGRWQNYLSEFLICVLWCHADNWWGLCAFMYWVCLSECMCVARSGLSCMLQQAIARNGGFPRNTSDWAGLYYNVPHVSQPNRHKIWLFLNWLIFFRVNFSWKIVCVQDGA